jgi:hypothetical protein
MFRETEEAEARRCREAAHARREKRRIRLAAKLESERSKIRRIEERMNQLASQRVDAEEREAELIEKLRRLASVDASS